MSGSVISGQFSFKEALSGGTTDNRITADADDESLLSGIEE